MNLRKLFGLFVIIIFITFLITSYSPELVIRRHFFLINPAQSFTCTIEESSIVDKEYGQQYIIKGLNDHETGVKIFFAYVKKNFIGMYYWSGGGTGP